MKVGVITSTRLTHATPAVFVTSNENRANENEMATDFPKAGIDFYAGGGYRHFAPKSGDLKSSRKDEVNVIQELSDNGYKTFIGENSSKEFLEYSPKNGENVFAALTSSHLPYEVDRINDPSTPSLAQTTKKGIETLSKDNKNGFFLMVEGGRIDNASHAQYAVGTIMDTLALDDAIYAPTSIAVAHILSQRAGLQWTSFAHTATQVPLSAKGATSENFIEFKDNTDAAKEIGNQWEENFKYCRSFQFRRTKTYCSN